MNTQNFIVSGFTITSAFGAVLIAFAFITIMSFVKEPLRQKINAIIIAGAGGVYWSGGLGVWEYIFGAVMLIVAFKGLQYYNFIGIGWLLHTSWDVLHHFYGNPIINVVPLSSAGCAVCDFILALWFFFGAPTIWNVFKKRNTITT